MDKNLCGDTIPAYLFFPFWTLNKAAIQTVPSVQNFYHWL